MRGQRWRDRTGTNRLRGRSGRSISVQGPLPASHEFEGFGHNQCIGESLAAKQSRGSEVRILHQHSAQVKPAGDRNQAVRSAHLREEAAVLPLVRRVRQLLRGAAIRRDWIGFINASSMTSIGSWTLSD